jgi:hypothetical protein
MIEIADFIGVELVYFLDRELLINFLWDESGRKFTPSWALS